VLGSLGFVVVFLVVVLIVLPLVELAVMLQVAQWIGVLPALGLLIGISILGVWVVKRQGGGVLRRIRDALRAGQVPTAALVDAVCIVAAGTLLIVPGFVTDLRWLLLLVPLVRAIPRGWVQRRLVIRAAAGVGNAGMAVAARSRERTFVASTRRDREPGKRPALEPPPGPHS